MKKQDSNIAKHVKQAVLEVSPTAQLILFGSRARGDAKPDSDWDFLVLVDKENITQKDEMDFMDKIYPIELSSGENITKFIYSKNEWENKYAITSFHKNVMREGIVL